MNRNMRCMLLYCLDALSGVSTYPKVCLLVVMYEAIRNRCVILYRYLFAPVAQLDRAFGYEPKGRPFDSVRAYHLNQALREIKSIF